MSEENMNINYAFQSSKWSNNNLVSLLIKCKITILPK